MLRLLVVVLLTSLGPLDAVRLRGPRAAVDRRLGSCWLRVEASGRCSALYAINVTQAECCALHPGGVTTVSHATGWTPYVEMTSRQYFYWVIVGNGAPDCKPCRTSCDGFHCGSGGKVCRIRHGQPRCVCPSDCSALMGRGPGDSGFSRQNQPVCAFDGRTYRNQCQLARQNCRLNKAYHIEYFGPCQLSCASVTCPSGKSCRQDQNGVPHCIGCPETCPRSSPMERVCGTDGQTYPNLCALERQACLNSRSIGVSYAGECHSGMTCSHLRCMANERCLMYETSGMPVCVHCDRPCYPEISGHRTLCGTDGVTYTTYCEMFRRSCDLGVVIEAQHAGACGSSGLAGDYVDETGNEQSD